MTMAIFGGDTRGAVSLLYGGSVTAPVVVLLLSSLREQCCGGPNPAQPELLGDCNVEVSGFAAVKPGALHDVQPS